MGCRRVGARRNIYSFASDDKLHDLLRLYWSNVSVSFVPALLFSSLRRLKSLGRLRARRPCVDSTTGGDVTTAADATGRSGDQAHIDFPGQAC